MDILGQVRDSPCMDVKALSEDEYQKHLFAEISWLESNPDSTEEIQREWKLLHARMEDHLGPRGAAGWDYYPMDWPKNIPLYNISLSNRALSAAVGSNEIAGWLRDLKLNWRIRVELYDSIEEGIMTLGAPLGEMLVARKSVTYWGAFA